MLESETPALLVRSFCPEGSFDGTDGSVTDIIEQAKRASRRLDQAIREGVAETQIGGGAIVIVGSDRPGRLIESLRAVRQHAGGTGTRLAVVDAVASAHYRFGFQQIRKAKAGLEILPVGDEVAPFAAVRKHFTTEQWARDSVSRERVGVGNSFIAYQGSPLPGR